MRYAVVVLAIAGAARAMGMAIGETDLRYDVVLLGDPVAARDDKLRAVDELGAAGLAAVPLLIERLKNVDDAVFLDDVPLETGPMNPGPPVKARTTARFMCELVLYRIIAPEPASPSVALGARSKKTGLDATRPAGGIEIEVPRPPVAWGRDWSGFWAKHKGESLDTIKRFSQSEIDRVWSDAAMNSTAAPSLSGDVPHLPVSTGGTAAALASSASGVVLTAWNDPSLPAARDAYVKARAIYREAKSDIGKRATARKQLDDAAKREPRLRVHVAHWLTEL